MGYLMESYTKKSELWYYEILQHLKLKAFLYETNHLCTADGTITKYISENNKTHSQLPLKR